MVGYDEPTRCPFCGDHLQSGDVEEVAISEANHWWFKCHWCGGHGYVWANRIAK